MGIIGEAQQAGAAERQTIDQAVEIYGHEAARRILGSMLNAFALADKALQPVEPADVLRLAFADIPLVEKGLPMPRVLGLHDKYSGFSLLLDRQDAAGVEYDLPYAVFHETANMARYQHGLERGEITLDTGFSAFRLLITEGVAVLASEMLGGKHVGLGEAEFAWYSLSEDVLRQQARSLLKGEVLLGTDTSVLTFMRGTLELPRLGYKLGHYLVDMVARHGGYDLAELARLPTATYGAILRQAFGLPTEG